MKKLNCPECGAVMSMQNDVEAANCPLCKIPMVLAEEEGVENSYQHKASDSQTVSEIKTAQPVNGFIKSRKRGDDRKKSSDSSSSGITKTATPVSNKNENTQEAERESREIIEAAEKKADRIISSARKQAEELANELIEKAEQEVEQIFAQADKQVERKLHEAEKEAKKIIGEAHASAVSEKGKYKSRSSMKGRR